MRWITARNSREIQTSDLTSGSRSPPRAAKWFLTPFFLGLVGFWLKRRNAEDSAELSLKFPFAASLIQQCREG